MSIQLGPKIVTNGLIFYLNATTPESYAGSADLWTSLGYTDNSVITNAKFANNTYFEFDGTLSGSIKNSITLGTNFTVEVATAIYGQRTNTYWLGGSSTDGIMGIYGDNLYIYGSAQSNRLDISPITLNKWYNITITHELTGGDARIVAYKDGVFTDSTIYTYSSLQNMTFIGKRGNTSSGGAMSGSLASMRIYNRVLNSTEILQNHKAIIRQ